MKREAALSRRQMLARVGAGRRRVGAGGLRPAVEYAGEPLDSRCGGKPHARVQRALLAPRDALAPEYAAADLSPGFKPNGSIDPDDPDYVKARDEHFANWKLESAASSTSRCNCRSPTSGDCRRARRSRATIASRAGVASANGKARRSEPILDDGRAEACGALHRLLLRRHAGADARRDGAILRDDRSRRRFSSADDPRL